LAKESKHIYNGLNKIFKWSQAKEKRQSVG